MRLKFPKKNKFSGSFAYKVSLRNTRDGYEEHEINIWKWKLLWKSIHIVLCKISPFFNPVSPCFGTIFFTVLPI